MNIQGTDFVLYYVADLNTAARFYRESLGLPQTTYNEEWQWAEFSCGNVTLALKGGEKPSSEPPRNRLALAVDDIHAAATELRTRGVTITREPTNYTVCWAMEIGDPDGNAVILHQRADGTCGQSPASKAQETEALIALERSAMDRWAKGDPSGFLEICSRDVTYFDPSLDQRLDGLEGLARLYEKMRGKIHLDRYELINPQAQIWGDAAVLTYNYIGESAGETNRWNCTEVYQRTAAGWRIVHTHWSLTKPA